VLLDKALRCKWSDDFAAATSIMDLVEERAVLGHDESILSGLLFQRGELEAWAGDLPTAERCAARSDALGAQHGAPVITTRFLHALLAVYAGRVDEARRNADDEIRVGAWTANHRLPVRCIALLGQLDLALGDVPSARRWLLEATELAERAEYGEPAVLRFDADTIEALILAGEPDLAEPLLERLEERGHRLGRRWTLATSARCRGLLESVRGNEASASAAFEQSLRILGSIELPYELARTQLAYGTALRRWRRLRRARAMLDEALASFERIGMPLWAIRARTERARIGGRAPAPDALTATELQVAELAAAGMTNREVAERAAMSVKTVESHLGHVYGKLQVRSRTELAHAIPRPAD
jgi:DNA-binding CsgD family transcriptional regulator